MLEKNWLNKIHKKLWGIILISIVVKLIIWGVIFHRNPDSVITSDTELYQNSALTILHSGAFNVDLETPTPQTIIQPGYALFLASIYFLVGESFSAVALAQIAVSSVTLYLAYWLATHLWNEKTGLLAVLILAMDVTTFSYTFAILTETLFTLLLTLMLACGFKVIKDKENSMQWSFLMGLSLSLATLVRPISYYLIIPLFIGVIIYYISQRLEWKIILTISALLLLPYLTLIGGWMARNYLLTGNASYNQLSGTNMLFYKGAGILAIRDKTDLFTAQEKYFGINVHEASMLALQHPEQKLSQKWQKQATQIFMENPALLLRMQVSSIFTLLLGSGETTLLQFIGYPIDKTGPLGDLLRLSMSEYVQLWIIERPAAVLFLILAYLYLAIVYSANLYWMAAQIRKRDLSIIHLFFGGVFAYFLIVSAGPEAYYRFRVPITPILAIYAAEGINIFFTQKSLLKSAPSQSAAQG